MFWTLLVVAVHHPYTSCTIGRSIDLSTDLDLSIEIRLSGITQNAFTGEDRQLVKRLIYSHIEELQVSGGSGTV